jgi:hypothetical protein
MEVQTFCPAFVEATGKEAGMFMTPSWRCPLRDCFCRPCADDSLDEGTEDQRRCCLLGRPLSRRKGGLCSVQEFWNSRGDAVGPLVQVSFYAIS